MMVAVSGVWILGEGGMVGDEAGMSDPMRYRSQLELGSQPAGCDAPNAGSSS